jgi:hypothetical protein
MTYFSGYTKYMLEIYKLRLYFEPSSMPCQHSPIKKYCCKSTYVQVVGYCDTISALNKAVDTESENQSIVKKANLVVLSNAPDKPRSVIKSNNAYN